MATATHPGIAPHTLSPTLTLEEYLNTSYRPDCDFVDDHIEERNLGTPKHSLLQMELGFWFRSHRSEWKVRVMGDVRTRTRQTRVRLPDVAVVRAESMDLEEKAISSPPLIAIEILSPEDRMSRVLPRMEEFLAMGVAHVWLLDPVKRIAYTLTAAGLNQVNVSRLTLPDSPIYLDLPELFSALDE